MDAVADIIEGYKAARTRLWGASSPQAKKPRDILFLASISHLEIGTVIDKPPQKYPAIVKRLYEATEDAELAEKKITVREIIAQVCEKRGVSRDAICSARRNHDLVLARHEIMWRAREETVQSLPQIARALGDRDHTTVLHGIRRHQARIDAGEVAGS